MPAEEVEQAVAASGVVEAQHDRAAVLSMEEQRSRLLAIVNGCLDDTDLDAHYRAVHDALQGIGATMAQQSALIMTMRSNPSKAKTAELINHAFLSAENQKKHEVDDDVSRQLAGAGPGPRPGGHLTRSNRAGGVRWRVLSADAHHGRHVVEDTIGVCVLMPLTGGRFSDTSWAFTHLFVGGWNV